VAVACADVRNRTSRWVGFALLTAMLVVSLGMRLDNLDVFLTADEPLWYTRSLNFREALITGDYAATYQRHHPGVLTMWSGALAANFVEWVDGIDPAVEVGQRVEDGRIIPPGVQPLTQWSRRVIGVVTWLGIIGIVLLVRHVFGNRIAAIALPFVALDPFFLAHSRVHHLDAVLTTFMTLSALSLVAAERRGLHIGYLALSAASAGLAFANKVSAGFLAPWLMISLVVYWITEHKPDAAAPRRRPSVWKLLGLGLLWGLVMILAFGAVWPAIWVSPVETVRLFVERAVKEGTTPHSGGNFFLGVSRADPGAGLYPMAWILRSTPWVVIGVILALYFTVRLRHRMKDTRSLWLYVVVISAAMMLNAKKFDRYLLPIFPVMDVLAAWGWGLLLERLIETVRRRYAEETAFLAVVAVMAVSQFAMVWPTRPYYLSYYNPLAGGTRTAPRLILVGWGEGMDQTGRYLSQKPNAENLVVANQDVNMFHTFFVGQAYRITEVPLTEPDYFVLYVNRVQREYDPDLLAILADQVPEHVVSINGLEYAWIYPNTIYQKEIRDIVSAIESDGSSEGAPVLFNTRVAFARHYRGPLSLIPVHQPTEDEAIADIVGQALVDREYLWFVHIPGIGDDTSSRIQEFLESHGDVTKQITIGDVVATRYDVS
jgi:4-amino-4-deoxy-L-arabinose transferase-like glycosyltransferase